MLQFLAVRRNQMKDFDLQEEEIKALNNVRILNDACWVCDDANMTSVLENSGLQAIVDKYNEATELNQIDRRMLNLLQFAY